MSNYKWSYELIKAEAAKYKKRSEFGKKCPAGYQYARKSGIMDDICSHMPVITRRWTVDQIKEEAIKYTTRTAFVEGSPAAYYSAYGKKILDVVCSHMEIKRHDWTIEEIQTEANKYTTRGEFSNKSHKAYWAAMKNGILDDVCSHMVSASDNKLPKLSDIEIEAKKYSTRTEFRKKNGNYYRAATKMGVLNKVCLRMKPIKDRWTVEKLQEIANQYKYRSDFRLNNDAAYQAAYYKGILEDICKHMTKRSQDIEIIKERIKKEASKYRSRLSFRLGNYYLYTKASTLRILDEVCEHMGKDQKD